MTEKLLFFIAACGADGREGKMAVNSVMAQKKAEAVCAASAAGGMKDFPPQYGDPDFVSRAALIVRVLYVAVNAFWVVLNFVMRVK